MTSPINIVIAVLWLLSALPDYAALVYAWQLKEYRADRFRDFLGTNQGKNFLLRYPVLWRSVLAVLIFLWPLNSVLSLKYILIAVFIGDILYNAYSLKLRRLLRPVLTMKALILLLGTPFLEAALFVYTGDWSVLLLLTVLRFFIVALSVFSLNVFTTGVKRLYIWRASKRLKRYKDLKVIGITGSYGKTTVKEFLASLLSEKFHVIKTPKNINTEIGIAQFILQTDFNKAEIFVVEMGAYRIGEIAVICDMVNPTIGLLTAINEQHLSLFGSIKNTQKAKYELLRSIPKTGIAITNSDNKYCREYLGELEARTQTFGVESMYQPSFLIHDLLRKKGMLSFIGTMKWENCEHTFEIVAPFMGEHNAMNLAPCIMIAHELGVSAEDIIDGCKTLTLPDKTLSIFKYGKATVIDDSYNANPEGFKAALDVLSKYPSSKKRVVVTRGMLELGDRSDALHEQIAGEISFVADELILVNKDFYEPMRSGLVDKYRANMSIIEEPTALLSYMKELAKEDAVILLENRINPLVYDELKRGEQNV